MASILYKKVGDKVDTQLVEIEYLAQELEFGGWFTCSTGEAKTEKLDTDGDGDISKDEADTNETGKLSNLEIRAAAKEAGIEDWETGRIKGLSEKLWPTQK